MSTIPSSKVHSLTMSTFSNHQDSLTLTSPHMSANSTKSYMDFAKHLEPGIRNSEACSSHLGSPMLSLTPHCLLIMMDHSHCFFLCMWMTILSQEIPYLSFTSSSAPWHNASPSKTLALFITSSRLKLFLQQMAYSCPNKNISVISYIIPVCLTLGKFPVQ